MDNVHFKSNSSEWSTPQWLFDRYNDVYKFNLDVCATPENAKCNKYYTKDDNGLIQSWHGNCWMNPPYGREITKWVEKAYIESLNNGVLVICLLPARTDTKWFHEYCTRGNINFLKGRLKFGNATNSAPFPSMIVQFDNLKYKFGKSFGGINK